MIQNKAEMKDYLATDMQFFHAFSLYERRVLRITKDPLYEIAKYLKYLRKEEYYANCRRDILGRICSLYYLRRKNFLGNKLGFKIPRNTFKKGLTIYHHGMIIINENVRVGENACLHGGNCIGNNGIFEATPVVGDNLDLGIGAMIIGDVRLGNNIKVGANAVVTKSFYEDGITLLGVPAGQK